MILNEGDHFYSKPSYKRLIFIAEPILTLVALIQLVWLHVVFGWPLIVLVCSLVVLLCPLVVPIFPLIVLVCPLVSVCPIAVFVVLAVGLLRTDSDIGE